MKKLSKIVLLVAVALFAVGCAGATDTATEVGGAVDAAGEAVADGAEAVGEAAKDGVEAAAGAVEDAAAATKEAVSE